MNVLLLLLFCFLNIGWVIDGGWDSGQSSLVKTATAPLYVTSGNITIDTTSVGAPSGWTTDSSSKTTTNYNVGIGTSVPLSKLSILGIGTTSATRSFNIMSSDQTSKFNVFDNGNVGIGTINPLSKLHIVGTAADSFCYVDAFRENSSGGGFVFRHARGVPGAITAVSANDQIGAIHYQGYDGTGFNSGAFIGAYADAAPTTGVTQGRISLWTTDYTGSLAEKLRITPLGNIGIDVTNPSSVLEVSGASTFDKLMVSSSTAAHGDYLAVKNSGNVGVGTVTPRALLDVYSIGTANPNPVLWVGSSDSVNNGIKFGAGGAIITGGNSTVQIFYTGSSGLTVNSTGIGSTGGTLSFGGVASIVRGGTGLLTLSTNASHIVLAPAGNVGIGTTVPVQKLEVNGVVQVDAAIYLKSPDGTISACGPSNTDVWTCTGL